MEFHHPGKLTSNVSNYFKTIDDELLTYSGNISGIDVQTQKKKQNTFTMTLSRNNKKVEFQDVFLTGDISRIILYEKGTETIDTKKFFGYQEQNILNSWATKQYRHILGVILFEKEKNLEELMIKYDFTIEE